MKKILITGGLGFVGGRLAKKLAGKFDITVSTRKNIEHGILEQNSQVMHVLHNQILLIDSFPENIDTVIHLAALNEWDCVKHPSEAIKVNIDETRIILENAINTGVKNFIYFSTAHIYGSPLQGIITEQTMPFPVHPYAITHKAAEDYVVAAALQKKIQSIVIRLSNSFGAPQLPSVNRWTLLVNDLCRQAIEKESLTLLSNGCQYRDFICLSDVEEVVYGIISGAVDFRKIIYNLGAGVSMRVIDMANVIASMCTSLFDKNIPVYLPAGAITTEEPAFIFSIERLLSEGCIIKNDVQAELKQLLQFCDLNFSKLD